MAGRENTLKRSLIRKMGTRWHVQSHEDRFSVGIPDLSYGFDGVNGWIELKQIKEWPKRPDTPAKPDKYTPEQVNWLMRRGRKAGHCYVLVRVGSNEHFLFNWTEARDVRQGMPRALWYEKCMWTGSLDPDALLRWLT